MVDCLLMLLNVLLQHGCVYVKRTGQFHANQAQEQLDELAKHCTPVCYSLNFSSELHISLRPYL